MSYNGPHEGYSYSKIQTVDVDNRLHSGLQDQLVIKR